MKRLLTLAAIAGGVLALALFASSAGAANRLFLTNLTGAEETPPVDTRAHGHALFLLDRDGDSMKFLLIATRIENVTAAHIHCGGPGVAGPVVVNLLPHGAPPAGAFNGVLSLGTFSDADVIDRPDSAACPGGISSFDDLLEKMEAGQTYVNVHTSANPGGEIRGQLD